MVGAIFIFKGYKMEYKERNINHFDTEWKWGKSTIVLIDNCGIINIQFENGYYYGYISDLKVSPKNRRQGIATELMKKAESLIIENGFNEAQLKVEKDHSFQYEWYKRLGYNVIIEDEDYFYMRKIFENNN